MVEIKTSSSDQKEILIAELSELGYEFEEERNLLKAFILAAAFNEKDIDNIISNKSITYSLSEVLQRNWNAEWEMGFQPVIVDNYCCIRAKFHPAVAGVEYDVIVTPQMSFGTGHHATTYMMVQAMRQIDIKGKSVFDFGTGTGVLAILATKLGAGKIVAMDNDEWSIENAATNFTENGISGIHLFKADTLGLNEQFEVILANINRNVILQSLPAIKQHLAPGGVVVFSGLLEDDREIILQATDKQSFKLIFSLEKESWICLAFN